MPDAPDDDVSDDVSDGDVSDGDVPDGDVSDDDRFVLEISLLNPLHMLFPVAFALLVTISFTTSALDRVAVPSNSRISSCSS